MNTLSSGPRENFVALQDMGKKHCIYSTVHGYRKKSILWYTSKHKQKNNNNNTVQLEHLFETADSPPLWQVPPA